MGISRDSRHKRAATGAKRAFYRKKRKFELGRQAANTKIGGKRIHVIRVRGGKPLILSIWKCLISIGNLKYRALRLETGNFAWGSESCTKKTRIIRVVYNATNNELVRTNTLVKGSIVEVDAAPFRQWYEAHYALPIGRKKKSATDVTTATEELRKGKSNHVLAKIDGRKAVSKVDVALDEQFAAGRVLARLTSRPGQSGRADGVVLEGKELEFYLRKMKSRKA